MRNLAHQTKQAFYFSLGFYFLAIVMKLLHFSFADILVSIALLLSLLWTVLVLRELMLSRKLSNTERLLLIIFIIFGNIIAGIVYFFFIREKVVVSTGK
ncbi:hypothetical protein [Sphingobacterium bambusae]|uniref:Cardiolipin synthase N-terminal domain-containing protein n=1 Tax=Sphingobacterium bambusae TaxID=662858 RepID=A0ABW6BM78_9SPHI|nr:hypothetical protein [Sphingobacterium bambusae]WPL51072.1 hypothetical protein SCB77_11500 [Sphingobacterium bambusae]